MVFILQVNCYGWVYKPWMHDETINYKLLSFVLCNWLVCFRQLFFILVRIQFVRDSWCLHDLVFAKHYWEESLCVTFSHHLVANRKGQKFHHDVGIAVDIGTYFREKRPILARLWHHKNWGAFLPVVIKYTEMLHL